ncbi:MAG TPA: prolyl oligopeptidase family serine peptidase [Acidobacteriaceae bacterium]|jgi:dipeptidyl aminopeptidase/acylaminoacyl peptidase|nr:prolyl oligopeptidase family serine peptidase [Acidobacteriaceae bacterium]
MADRTLSASNSAYTRARSSRLRLLFGSVSLAVFAALFAGLTAPACKAQAQQTKPLLTQDEFFSYTEIDGMSLAPDGNSAVLCTSRADWKQNRFRQDLWLWRAADNSITPLTSTGHDRAPHFSPDGKYIAFISERSLPDEKPTGADADASQDRVWILPVAGGEAFPLYREPLSVDAFTWSADGKSIFVATQQPLTADQKTAETKEWKDTIRWRDQRRGDVLLRIAVAAATPNAKPLLATATQKNKQAPLPEDAAIVAHSPLAIDSLVASPDGANLAFESRSLLNRQENPADYEIFLVSATGVNQETPRQLTHNEAYESSLHWGHDSTTLYFSVPAASGSAEHPYQDVQGRLYAMDIASSKLTRLGSNYSGNWEDYALAQKGGLVGLGQTGTETQVYTVHGGQPEKVSGVAGTYARVVTATHSPKLLLVHSALDAPEEVYLADDAAHLTSAKPITHFNKLFTERALPRWKTYQWKADDGTTIEGVLIYPPGKFGQKNLRMFTLIHGGPADADGDRFGADWYDWAILAATNNWLVFRPNYRGSSGYGDKFMLDISPVIVSRPGKDILAGVDKLVADGIADPNHLAVGGYSYGGYMTDWLITQTDRFRSAVSGAGAIEHASNWGNDDMSHDDAWMLGGTPWQQPARYQSEAALFIFNKVKTPVHDVIGGSDIRVAASQGYLMERALQTLDIPHEFLVFPGEGHGLGINPWHGYIKVRDELLWLQKYDAAGK